MSVLVKICGTTSVADARLAEAAGADYVGIVVEHPPSPRSVSLEQAVAIRRSVSVPVVAVTVNLPVVRLLAIVRELHPAAMQLHGDEGIEVLTALRDAGVPVWPVVSGETNAVKARAALLREAGAEALLLDAREASPNGVIYGGTGRVADWHLARELAASGARLVLAGGLTPENVTRAIKAVHPWMVDVVSGVEASKGRKDRDKVRAFIEAARSS